MVSAAAAGDVVVREDEGAASVLHGKFAELLRRHVDRFPLPVGELFAAEDVPLLVEDKDAENFVRQARIVIPQVLPEGRGVVFAGRSTLPFGGVFFEEERDTLDIARQLRSHPFDLLQRRGVRLEHAADRAERFQEFVRQRIGVLARHGVIEQNFQKLVLFQRVRVIFQFFIHAQAMSFVHAFPSVLRGRPRRDGTARFFRTGAPTFPEKCRGKKSICFFMQITGNFILPYFPKSV